jgi:hypothetical protein
MAEVYYELSQYPKALDLLAQIKTSSNEQILLQAKIHNTLGKFDLALAEIENYTYQQNTESELIYLNTKTKILKASGQSDLAYSLADIMLEKAEKLYGKGTVKYADYLIDFSDLNSKVSDSEKVLGSYLNALDILKTKTKKLKVAKLLKKIARKQQLLNKLNKAEENLIKVRKIYKKVYGEEHLIFANIQISLGNVYKHQLKTEEAKEQYNSALKIYKSTYGEESWQQSLIVFNVGLLYLSSNKYDLAIVEITKAINLLSPVKDKKEILINSFKVKLAESYIHTQSFVKANKLLNEIIPFFESQKTHTVTLLAKSRLMLSIIKLIEKDYKKAKELEDKSLTTVSSYPKSNHLLISTFFKYKKLYTLIPI